MRERKVLLCSCFVVAGLPHLNRCFHRYLLYFSYGEIILQILKCEEKKKSFPSFFFFHFCGFIYLNHNVVF